MATPHLSSYTESHSFARGMTRAGVGGVRSSDHLKKALAEIDGLFAGLNYIERTDSWKQKPDATSNCVEDLVSHFNSDIDAHAFAQAEDEMQLPHRAKEGKDSTHNHQTHEYVPPSNYDWSSIRNVKEGSEHLWREFDALAEELDRPAINQIRNIYNDAKGLREAGVFTFRNTVSGTAPNDLRHIFAFASLSYVISCLLCKEGRIARTDILSGVRVWRDAIKRDDERKAFVELARGLWPEAHEHFHFINLDLPTQSFPLEPTPQAEWWTGSANAHNPMEVFQREGQQIQSNVTEESNTAWFQGLSELDPTDINIAGDWSQAPFYNASSNDYNLLQMQIVGLTAQTHETWHWSDGQNIPIHQPESSHWMPEALDRPPESHHGQNAPFAPRVERQPINETTQIGDSGEAEVSEGTTSQCDRLRDTMTFQVILKYLHRVNRFLSLLSGGGLTAKEPHAIDAFNNEQRALKQMIQEQYLDPLANSQILVSSQARAILAIAKEFVKLGCLQNISEVQDYMITVGQEILQKGPSFPKFCRWVLSSQLEPVTPSVDGSHSDDSHGRSAPDSIVATPTTSTSSQPTCSICKRSFSNYANLTRHKKSHDPTKSLQCPACDFTDRCGRRDKLRVHWTSKHSGQDIPFPLA